MGEEIGEEGGGVGVSVHGASRTGYEESVGRGEGILMGGSSWMITSSFRDPLTSFFNSAWHTQILYFALQPLERVVSYFSIIPLFF